MGERCLGAGCMKANREESVTAAVFSSELGWMGLLWRDAVLTRVVFGHPSKSSAARGVGASSAANASLSSDMKELVDRLRQFARGVPDDFLDVRLDWSGRTPFQRAVLQCCRRIPYGEVVSYGELAQRAGSPRSARAVGNVMASNRTPLIVPCHRVVASGGVLGGFSAPGGITMKQRLLTLEEGTSRRWSRRCMS